MGTGTAHSTKEGMVGEDCREQWETIVKEAWERDQLLERAGFAVMAARILMKIKEPDAQLVKALALADQMTVTGKAQSRTHAMFEIMAVWKELKVSETERLADYKNNANLVANTNWLLEHGLLGKPVDKPKQNGVGQAVYFFTEKSLHNVPCPTRDRKRRAQPVDSASRRVASDVSPHPAPLQLDLFVEPKRCKRKPPQGQGQ